MWRQGTGSAEVRTLLESLSPETVVSVHGTVLARPTDMQKVRAQACLSPGASIG